MASNYQFQPFHNKKKTEIGQLHRTFLKAHAIGVNKFVLNLVVFQIVVETPARRVHVGCAVSIHVSHPIPTTSMGIMDRVLI